MEQNSAVHSKKTNHSSTGNNTGNKFSIETPAITLPRGGGAIRSIDEKFSVNAINGTSSFSIPLPFSGGRGYTPSMSLSYSSGGGNGIFGMGWHTGISSVKRKTDKALPQYIDENDTDVFIISDAEDLVPEYKKDINGVFLKTADDKFIVNEFSSADGDHLIRRYRPRTEGHFSRIERWLEKNSGIIHWRMISADNTTTIFGSTPASRIFNPQKPEQVFEWLIDFTFDDKGRCASYEYVAEDGSGIAPEKLHNRNRVNGTAPFTNTYLKKVRYGNVAMYHRGDAAPSNYMFETVFDYGEHENIPPFNNTGNWNFRSDAFSDYRAGFEVRNCRLCKRVLLYHHFTELPGGSALVKALHFEYDNNGAEGFTFLRNITTTGYTKHDDGSYTEKSAPPLSFTYSEHKWDRTVRSISETDLVHAPTGIDEPRYQFTDLYNEGLNGILSEQAGGWFYKSNLGNGHFTEAVEVGPRPSYHGLATGAVQLADLDTNGIKQLVNWNHPAPGYFEMNDEGEWQPYTVFKNIPNINLKDANTRMIDLNGDGRPDLLITEQHAFTWYASKGKEGYEACERIIKSQDEEKGPVVVFADATQTIFLSNMSGSGLTDIVRIRNGEVCYWPNLGYGKFGAKVSMDDAPVFDHPEKFNPSLVKLADIDGSGTTDIIYLGHNQVNIWFNRQGNSFSTVPEHILIPEINQQTRISVIDLLGTGLSCIVWSSSLSKHQGRQLQYIDLMGSEKPHIMMQYANNLGKEVMLEYTPSTKYYIDDKLAGRPWITKLHFPVHCVSKVITIDRIMKTRFASEYSYHHGYYDHFEKEFRGFGRVDQKDAEDIAHFIKESNDNANNIIDATLHQPPLLTRLWYHTGAFLDRKKILGQFAHEYFQNNIVPEKILPEPELPATLTNEEWRQALRACKGTLLRKEIYALDGSPAEHVPYAVDEHNTMIRMLQPAGQQKFGVFITHESESITYHYERNAADPRVTNDFTLDMDDYGNVRERASVAYKRQPPAMGAPPNEPEQDEVHITFDKTAYTNDIITGPDYHTPVTYESKAYEIGGFPAFTGYVQLSLLKTWCSTAAPIDYEEPFTGGLQKRITEFNRTQFRGNNGTTILPFGTLESGALKHREYKAAFNKQMLANVFSGKIAPAALEALLAHPQKGGYLFADNYYWVVSGTQEYDVNHFFLTTSVTDPFGRTTIVEYDTKYHLFLQKTTDALNNVSQIKELAPGSPAFNYRVLSPYIMMDVNDNETAVRFDELGMTTRSFIIGKKGTDEGDEIDESKVELKNAADQPTLEMIYSLSDWYDQKNAPGFDINNYKPHPSYTLTRSRETHYHAHPLHHTKWHEVYAYSDGGGHEILKKSQAEPGEALEVQPDGSVIIVDTRLPAPGTVRWVGNGRTILNNKGNAIKKYEPYFSTSPGYDDEKEMVELGVTPVTEYDPLDRVIKTTFPDKTFTKVELTPWLQKKFDSIDTVMDSDWYVDRGSPDPADPEPLDAETRAAWLSAKHYNTPEIMHLDAQGRTFLTIEDNKTETLESRKKIDIEGNEREITDALGRIVISYEYDMLGSKLKQTGLDAGSRYTINNVTGKPFLAWDDRDHQFSYQYDELQRAIASVVQTGAALPVMYERVEYGEAVPNAKTKNLRGKAAKQYDQSGYTEYLAHDFKANNLHTEKTFADEYKATIDWTVPALVAMQAVSFESLTAFDAMNRPVKITTPHTVSMVPSEIYPSYNEANLLNRVEASIRGAAARTVFVTDINYNAKGQREEIYYGNDTRVQYTYYKQSQRLKSVSTIRNAGADVLHNLEYVYDATGNIAEVNDAAIDDVFFDGEQVAALNRYEYDAVYRLVKAAGRKHAGQTDINHNRPDFNYRNHPFIPSQTISPNSATAFRNYREQYTYDKAGNMLEQKHISKNSSFTRTFTYKAGSNQLAETGVGAFNFKYIDIPNGIDYDAHGNMSIMEQVQELVWNFKDELHEADLGGGGNAWYIYGNDKQRVRKIVERANGDKEERYYLGVLEIYRETDNGGSITAERETLHIMDNQNRVAMIDTPIVTPPGSTETQLTRYQYANHLSSSLLELDELAAVISYEEYFPYGTTSFYTVDATREVAQKRYRYTGKERDEETGLNYHGARYYAPWLCRWIAADPAGISGGMNLYVYGANNPLLFNDPNGKNPHPAMDPALLRPDPDGMRVPGMTRLSIAPFTPVADPMGDVNANLNFRTVYTPAAGPGIGPGTPPLVDVPTQFGPGGRFLGTGDTHAYMWVDKSLRGSGVSTSVRQDHFSAYTSITGQRPSGFDVHVANERTVQQLQAGMDFRRTQIGQHVAEVARPQGLRIAPGTTLTRFDTSRGPNYMAQGNYVYQPIRARLDGAVAAVRSYGSAAVERVRSVARRAPSPGALAAGGGGGATLAARAASMGRVGVSTLVRTFVPGAAEAMDGAAMVRASGGARVVARAAVQPVVAGARLVASAAASAPGAVAVTAVAAGLAGAAVGNVVEHHVTAATGSRTAGVASGTLAGAATGALVGAAIGTVIPVVGTAAGAIIGGAAGAIGGFIASYW